MKQKPPRLPAAKVRSVQVSVYVPAPVAAKLGKLAKQWGESRSDIMRDAVEAFLKHSRPAAARTGPMDRRRKIQCYLTPTMHGSIIAAALSRGVSVAHLMASALVVHLGNA